MSEIVDKSLKKAGINVSKPLLAILCIIFGVVIIIFPQLVGYIIGLFLIISGIVLLVEYYTNTDNRNYRQSHLIND